jgi:uncharacterized membrane protein YphA (DoxX/SURF4 family)
MGMKPIFIAFQKPKCFHLLEWSIRILLAFVFISYGSGKLLGGQFGGLSPEELSTPIQELSLFKVGWYLFDHQPFKAVIGITQIVTSILLLIPRTKFIGMLILMPIILSILIIDLTIMPPVFQWSFGFRLSAYVLYLLWILLQYKPLFQGILRAPTTTSPFLHKAHYLWLLVMIPLLEFIPGILRGFAVWLYRMFS